MELVWGGGGGAARGIYSPAGQDRIACQSIFFAVQKLTGMRVLGQGARLSFSAKSASRKTVVVQWKLAW